MATFARLIAENDHQATPSVRAANPTKQVFDPATPNCSTVTFSDGAFSLSPGVDLLVNDRGSEVRVPGGWIGTDKWAPPHLAGADLLVAANILTRHPKDPTKNSFSVLAGRTELGRHARFVHVRTCGGSVKISGRARFIVPAEPKAPPADALIELVANTSVKVTVVSSTGERSEVTCPGEDVMVTPIERQQVTCPPKSAGALKRLEEAEKRERIRRESIKLSRDRGAAPKATKEDKGKKGR